MIDPSAQWNDGLWRHLESSTYTSISEGADVHLGESGQQNVNVKILSMYNLLYFAEHKTRYEQCFSCLCPGNQSQCGPKNTDWTPLTLVLKSFS